jgi:Type II secretory pathway, prepilin signal peptidase PulO and related peptidases
MIEAILAGLFGLLIGSFLNVCIYRLPLDLSVVRPRSFCPACEKPVAAWDNIPVLSWIILGGRCRQCRSRISLRYPAVELLTAALFFCAVLRLGFSPAGLKLCIFSAIQVALIFTDFEERILPDEFTWGGVAAGLALAYWIPLPRIPGAPPAALPVARSCVVGRRGRDRCSFPQPHALVHRNPVQRDSQTRRSRFGRRQNGGCHRRLPRSPGLSSDADSRLFARQHHGRGFYRGAKKDSATYELPFGSFLGVAALAVAFYLPPGSSL